MEQKRSHSKDVTGGGWTRDVALQRNLENLRSRQYDVQMTRWDYLQRARIDVGRVEVNAKRK